MKIEFYIVAILTTTFSFNLNSVWSWPDYYLYTKTSSNVAVNASLSEPTFSNQHKVYLIIHGFNGKGNDDYVLKIKDVLLERDNANVFAIDWSSVSSGIDYFNAANNVAECAKRITNFIESSKLNTTNIHCIGHSLGAHICGFVGKLNKLGRITGLDPAGPLFKGSSPDKRLDKTDANYVDVIHSDGVLGINEPIGHKDFYPNGGFSQTNCAKIVRKKRSIQNIISGLAEKVEDAKNGLIENLQNVQKEIQTNLQNAQNIILEKLLNAQNNTLYFLGCSHLRPTYLFANSLTNKCKFTSVKCNNYENYKNKKCTCETTGCTQMGYNSSLTNEMGTYYLETSGNEPFCLD